MERRARTGTSRRRGNAPCRQQQQQQQSNNATWGFILSLFIFYTERTHQVSAPPHSAEMAETSARHRSHSASQARRRSSVAPCRFVPRSPSSSAVVKCSGVLSLSADGSVPRYGEWMRVS